MPLGFQPASGSLQWLESVRGAVVRQTSRQGTNGGAEQIGWPQKRSLVAVRYWPGCGRRPSWSSPELERVARLLPGGASGPT